MRTFRKPPQPGMTAPLSGVVHQVTLQRESASSVRYSLTHSVNSNDSMKTAFIALSILSYSVGWFNTGFLRQSEGIGGVRGQKGTQGTGTGKGGGTGRFKSFPVESDEHLYTVLRYVERNPLRADLGQRVYDWQWLGSIFHGVGCVDRATAVCFPPRPL